jgi:hypothetical protein
MTFNASLSKSLPDRWCYIRPASGGKRLLIDHYDHCICIAPDMATARIIMTKLGCEFDYDMGIGNDVGEGQVERWIAPTRKWTAADYAWVALAVTTFICLS